MLNIRNMSSIKLNSVVVFLKSYIHLLKIPYFLKTEYNYCNFFSFTYIPFSLSVNELYCRWYFLSFHMEPKRLNQLVQFTAFGYFMFEQWWVFLVRISFRIWSRPHTSSCFGLSSSESAKQLMLCHWFWVCSSTRTRWGFLSHCI